MKKLALFIFILLSTFSVYASTTIDSLQHPTYANKLDSLRQTLNVTQYDSLKAGLYAQIAAQYLKYDTVANKKVRTAYQNEAINYTMLALHGYSKYNDTLGMRTCFNYLTKAYRAQKKFSQAKWFILQSNTISRKLNDKPNIIISLLDLAAIKMDIKDNSLAMRDLNEALKLSVDNRYPSIEAKVHESYAMLYHRTKNYAKEAIALKRRDFLNDSITRAEQALLAKANTQDTVQGKKKLLTSQKVAVKAVPSKRMASL